MFARFKVTKLKQPKKKTLFITKHFHPKNSNSKKKFKKEKSVEKSKPHLLNKTQPVIKPLKDVEKKLEKSDQKKPEKTLEKKNIIIPPKMPRNLFCILHNQTKIILHPPKKPEPLLKKKRLIDEETGNAIGRWSKDEHKKFIEAIIKFGNDWKEVQSYINTRTSTQARSHAQKFFEKIKKNKILKNFKSLNIDYSENFTNSTIMQLHNLYGNKSKNEINSVVNKFLSLEYDNPKKRRRVTHPYIGNKKLNSLGGRKNTEINGDIDENDENLDSNKNMDENNLNNKPQSYIEEYYGYNNNQKTDEEYVNFCNNILSKNAKQNYSRDGIDYILNQFVKNLSENCCDYDANDTKPKNKRKNTLGFDEEESNAYEDNIGYNLMSNNNINNANTIINNNIINNQNINMNMNISNNTNMNIMTRSRKNSIESRKKFAGIDEARVSFDMNEFYFNSIFEDDKALKL
jgi:SHAQKYF class myb-like DNA-binding protein